MSSDKVRYISTNTIQPATHSEFPLRIDLTPWDLNVLAFQYIQKGLLFLKPQILEVEETTPINRLRSSFSTALDFFPPLTGRLGSETHTDDNSVSFYINCNGTGAEFIHAVTDLSVADVLDPVYVPHTVRSFFPLNDLFNYDGLSKPLLAVQVTELTDGFFIGCSMNHVVVDGTSFWHFINSWSEIARTSNPTISRLPVLKRWFFNESSCPIRFPSSLEEEFVQRYTLLPPLEQRFFNFKREILAKLKAKANEEQSTDMISSLQAMLAHVWRAVARAKHLDTNQEFVYRLPIGNRTRLSPKLPSEYFGNSVQAVAATAKAGELVERGLGWAAGLLNKAITMHDDAAIRSFLENWTNAPVLVSFLKLSPNRLFTESSPRFDMYGNDFGWGRPIAVRSGCSNKFDGNMAVYQGAVEGSIDVEVCLSPQTLKAMEKDNEFMEVFYI